MTVKGRRRKWPWKVEEEEEGQEINLRDGMRTKEKDKQIRTKEKIKR